MAVSERDLQDGFFGRGNNPRTRAAFETGIHNRLMGLPRSRCYKQSSRDYLQAEIDGWVAADNALANGVVVTCEHCGQAYGRK